MEQKYAQCRLQSGTTCQTTWLPIQYAVPGKTLDLKERGSWTTGWKVLEVFDVQLDESYLRERAMDWRRTREASDI